MSTSRVDRFRRILAEAPANDFARFGLANALFDEGLFEEAAAEYRQCLEGRDDWMAVHIAHARCLVRLKRKDEAKAALEAARLLALKQGHSSPLEEIREILAELG